VRPHFRRPRAAAGAPLLLALAGCAGLLHSSAPPEQVYYLRAPEAAAAAAPASRSASLRVGHVSAAPGLDSPRIMLVRADQRMDFYAGSRWAAPAPEVIEALAVQTLRGSGAWSSVEDSTSPFPSDYVLQVQVRRFEADYAEAGAAPVVQVSFDCILGRREGRDVVATFIATGSAPAAANRLGAVVAAFEQASSSALNALAQQSEQAVRADPHRTPQNGENPDASMRR
jgi:cholesterol transport system auxiliary component